MFNIFQFLGDTHDFNVDIKVKTSVDKSFESVKRDRIQGRPKRKKQDIIKQSSNHNYSSIVGNPVSIA